MVHWTTARGATVRVDAGVRGGVQAGGGRNACQLGKQWGRAGVACLYALTCQARGDRDADGDRASSKQEQIAAPTAGDVTARVRCVHAAPGAVQCPVRPGSHTASSVLCTTASQAEMRLALAPPARTTAPHPACFRLRPRHDTFAPHANAHERRLRWRAALAASTLARLPR